MNNNYLAPKRHSTDVVEHGYKRMGPQKYPSPHQTTNLLDVYGPRIVETMSTIRQARLRSEYHFSIYRSSRCALSEFLRRIDCIVSIILNPNVPTTSQEMDNLKSTQELEASDETFMARLPWRLQTLRDQLSGADLPILHVELVDVISLSDRMVEMEAEVRRLELGQQPLLQVFEMQPRPRASRTG